jgi:hypothetical protein
MLEVGGVRRNVGGGEKGEGGGVEMGEGGGWRCGEGGGWRWRRGKGGGVQMGCEGGVKYSRIMAGDDVAYPPPHSLLPIMGMFVCPATNWTPRTLKQCTLLKTIVIGHTVNWHTVQNTDSGNYMIRAQRRNYSICLLVTRRVEERSAKVKKLLLKGPTQNFFRRRGFFNT